MAYTLVEIKNHKNKIYDLSTRLINTMDINEEFSINNEIKKETEFLLSLLNIKMNEINYLVDTHTTTPKLNNMPSEMVIGNTITVNDDAGVLSRYENDKFRNSNPLLSA